MKKQKRPFSKSKGKYDQEGAFPSNGHPLVTSHAFPSFKFSTTLYFVSAYRLERIINRNPCEGMFTLYHIVQKITMFGMRHLMWTTPKIEWPANTGEHKGALIEQLQCLHEVAAEEMAKTIETYAISVLQAVSLVIET